MDNYIVQLGIISNPHRDPKEGQKLLDDLWAESDVLNGATWTEPKLDKAAFEAFRKKTMENSKLLGASKKKTKTQL